MTRATWAQVPAAAWTFAVCFSDLAVGRSRRKWRGARGFGQRWLSLGLATLSMPQALLVTALVRPLVAEDGLVVLMLTRNHPRSSRLSAHGRAVGAILVVAGTVLGPLAAGLVGFSSAVAAVWFIPPAALLMRVGRGGRAPTAEWTVNAIASRGSPKAMPLVRAHVRSVVARGERVGFVAGTDDLVRAYERALRAERVGASRAMTWVPNP